MYIQQVFKYKTEWWRYIIGILIILIAWQVIGPIPLVVAAFFKAGNITAFVQAAKSNFMEIGFDLNLLLFLIMLMFIVGLLGVFFVVRFIHNQSIISLTTSRKKIDWKRFWFSFGLVAIISIITTLFDYFSNPQDYMLNFQFQPFLILFFIAIIMVPLQTSFEEYFFRAYLMQGIGTVAGNRWLPLIVTSVVFGSLHFFNPEVAKLGNIIMIYYIGTGFMLGILTLMDEGLELALGFHAANNLVASLLVTADWTAFQTNSIFKDVSDPSAGWDVLIPVLVVYPIFLYIMARKYGWNDWKNKLFGRVEKPKTLKLSEES